MWLKPFWLTAICFFAFCSRMAAQECTPHAAGLVQLKEALDSNYHDSPGNAGFRFRRIILEAACAANEKDREVVRRKIGFIWHRFLNEPVCTDSSRRLADLLPYAFSIGYQRLMLPVAKEWELDLNFFDGTNRTVLDLLDDAIANTKNASRARMLKEYREIYIGSGARRRADLSFFVKNLMTRFDEVKQFAYGLFPVRKNGKWGWVNEKGDVVIPMQYVAIRYFVKDLFEVSDDGVNFYYVDLHNIRANGPWDEQLPPWAGQPLQKKAMDANGDEITIFLSGDTLHTPDPTPENRFALMPWHKDSTDIIGYGYRDRTGTPYGTWKYYTPAGKKWELFCEGYYTMVKADNLLVNRDIERKFPVSSGAKAKDDFVNDLTDRMIFTGEWRFYTSGRIDRILVLDNKVFIPYEISESEYGTLTLVRAAQSHRMAGNILSECRFAESGYLKKMMAADLSIDFDNNGKPVIQPLPDLDFPVGN
ncbi:MULTISPECIES: WG repeat-containing protein [Niastella]|uniref:WG repeat-containing protein n=1 Tax=Niastella soli TaxID=2821487 RepID=A0ABS3YX68_9BACT|nr:WG repeat-containing protein [Niastella soli]MBO9202516.1 WG repeat-containing protein [Niastella soli]